MTHSSSAEALLARALTLADAGEARLLYRDWAATYDKTMLDELGYVTPQRTAGLLSQHLANRNATVLDVGSGTGLAGLELSRLGYVNVDALDFSPQMLGVAEARGVYRQLLEADLTKPLPLAKASYDAMICTGTFTHAHVGPDCLDELFRVLRPGGFFACTVHMGVWHESGFDKKAARLGAAGKLTTSWFAPGVYYSGSPKPDGYYVVWQRSAPED